MKLFLKKLMVYVLILAVIFVVPSVVIDPYNVFHWDNIRNNGVEPNKNYVKTKYVIANPDKFDGFLFGSSRVGSIHTENITDYYVYNMTYSTGLPQEQLETFKTFLDNGVKPEIVYLGVDSLSYTHDLSEHYENTLRCPYQYLKAHPLQFFDLYMNPKTILQSLKTILAGGDILGYETFYDYGWWCDYDEVSTVDWSEAQGEIGSANNMDEVIDTVQEFVDICNENNIKLVVFTNPMCEVTYQASIEADYETFLEKLSEVTPYYNFSVLNDITKNTDNFVDTSHYTAQIGDMMIDIMCNGSEPVDGFGEYIEQ